MSESRKALVGFVFDTFESNVVADPQQQILYAWQDGALDSFYKEAKDNVQIHMNQAIEDMNEWANNEGLAGIGSTFFECDEPIMLYNARLNRYECANKYPSRYLYECIHEFTHYWLLSAFSLGYDECKDSVISPLTAHGPIFVRALIMMLATYHSTQISEVDLETSATDSGVAIAQMSGENLRTLWKEWKTANMEFDNDNSRALIERTAELDRLVITGVRLP
ncbi:MAG TPA: hypothetical protein PKA27_13750 [Fimbriimonadaceae bacterium]|nr:hypothetical protein [Fimbriimonadaceae bacterium]